MRLKETIYEDGEDEEDEEGNDWKREEEEFENRVISFSYYIQAYFISSKTFF